MRVLVVDDMPANRQMLYEILVLKQYEPVLVSNGAAALDHLRQNPTQLAIVDWMMPEMDGVQLVRRIRAEIIERYVYVVILTAHGGQSDMITGLEAGADDYLTRPVLPRELLARVNIGKRIVTLENSLMQTLEQQRQSARLIEQTVQEWMATVDAIPQLVCLLNADGVVIRANQTVENWGLAWMSEAPGKTLADLMRVVYPRAAERIQAAWRVAQKRIAKGFEFEVEIRDEQTGHHFSVHFQPTDPFDESVAQLSSFAAVSIQDTTDRKQLELALEASYQETERLLFNTLPEPIVKRLKAGEETIADSYENVSVLFADIVGFTVLANQLDPYALVTMLNDIFSTFDNLVTQHGLEKIKTLGDGYLVVSGMPEPDDDHANAALNLALAMFEAMPAINARYQSDLNLRIGINSGPVVAGVIGKHKYAYDLWGDTVNVASRMESQGITGQIQITGATYQQLSQRAAWQERGLIDVKGKGTIKTYLLNPHDLPQE